MGLVGSSRARRGVFCKDGIQLGCVGGRGCRVRVHSLGVLAARGPVKFDVREGFTRGADKDSVTQQRCFVRLIAALN